MNFTKMAAPLLAAAVVGGGAGALVVAATDDGGTTTDRHERRPRGRVQPVARQPARRSPRARSTRRAKGSVAYITAEVTEQAESPVRPEPVRAGHRLRLRRLQGRLRRDQRARGRRRLLGPGEDRRRRHEDRARRGQGHLLRHRAAEDRPGLDRTSCRSRWPTPTTCTWATPPSRSAAPTGSSARSPPAW